MKTQYLILLVPLIITVLFSAFTYFTYWPEMLNYPFFISRGMVPYRDFSMVYTPLLPYVLTGIYQLIGFTGESMRMIATILLLFSTGMLTLFIFQQTKKIAWAVLAGIHTGLLAIAFQGNHLWFESILTPIFLGIFWVFALALKKLTVGKIFFAGLLIGISLMIKQTSVNLLPVWGIFFFYLLKAHKVSWKQSLKWTTYLLLPIIIVLSSFGLYLVWQGNLADFIFWGIKFPTALPFIHGPNNLTPDLTFPDLYALLHAGPLYLLAIMLALIAKKPIIFVALLGMLFSSLLAFPLFQFFHLQPAIFFFITVVLLSAQQIKNYGLVLAIFAGLCLIIEISMLRLPWDTGSDEFLGSNTKQVATWITENRPNASIYSLNGPDLVYVLAGKRPSTLPWVDQLSWNMGFLGEDNYARIIAAQPPDIIIFKSYWKGQYRPEPVLKYVLKNYGIVKRFDYGVEILERY